MRWTYYYYYYCQMHPYMGAVQDGRGATTANAEGERKETMIACIRTIWSRRLREKEHAYIIMKCQLLLLLNVVSLRGANRDESSSIFCKCIV